MEFMIRLRLKIVCSIITLLAFESWDDSPLWLLVGGASPGVELEAGWGGGD